MSANREGKLRIAEGKQRSGKTLSSVILTYSDYRKGRPIYSNIQLLFPFKPLNFFELTMAHENGELEGSTILIDELNFLADSRGSMSTLNKNFTHWILQIKKSDINVNATSHEMSFLDLRIRQHYDQKIIPKCYPENRKDGEPPRLLKMNFRNGPNQKPLNRTLPIDPTPYLGLYDTTNRINPFEEVEKHQEKVKKEKIIKKVKTHQVFQPRRIDYGVI